MGPRMCWILPLMAAVVSAQNTVNSCPPDTCGENAICTMLNGVPKCECPKGRYGNAWKRCMAECEEDSDCSSNWFCEKFRCKPVCSANACARSADCSVVDHRPFCKCPPGFKGNPNVECLPDCEGNSHCPNNMACYYPRCVDPCQFSCGKNALCEVRNHVAVCRCPTGMTGNPMQKCRPITPEDVCSPNPCGKNAECIPRKDDKNHLIAYCSCPPGYHGDALTECTKGDCIKHADCLENMMCMRSKCINPCKDTMCPPPYTCMVHSHQIFCLPKRKNSE